MDNTTMYEAKAKNFHTLKDLFKVYFRSLVEVLE